MKTLSSTESNHRRTILVLSLVALLTLAVVVIARPLPLQIASATSATSSAHSRINLRSLRLDYLTREGPQNRGSLFSRLTMFIDGIRFQQQKSFSRNQILMLLGTPDYVAETGAGKAYVFLYSPDPAHPSIKDCYALVQFDPVTNVMSRIAYCARLKNSSQTDKWQKYEELNVQTNSDADIERMMEEMEKGE